MCGCGLRYMYCTIGWVASGIDIPTPHYSCPEEKKLIIYNECHIFCATTTIFTYRKVDMK